MTIRNKLVWGFAAILLLMASIAATGAYVLTNLKQGAAHATRVGGQLYTLSLEIRVHNLEAQTRVMRFLRNSTDATPPGAGSSSNSIEDALSEIHEARVLARKAIRTAPSVPERIKFEKVATSLNAYEAAIQQMLASSGLSRKSGDWNEKVGALERAAQRLHEDAEDGEAVGLTASQDSLEQLEQTAAGSVMLVTAVSVSGLFLGLALCVALGRAILIPVEHLKDIAESVSLGNLDIAVRRFSNDEIGDLADSFGRLVTTVKGFRKQAEQGE